MRSGGGDDPYDEGASSSALLHHAALPASGMSGPLTALTPPSKINRIKKSL